jgi:hypothetical protein
MNSREQSSDPEPLGPLFELQPMVLKVPPRMARRLRCLAHDHLGDARQARHFALAALCTAICEDDLKARQLMRADRIGARRWPQAGDRSAAGTGPKPDQDRFGARVVRLRTPR